MKSNRHLVFLTTIGAVAALSLSACAAPSGDGSVGEPDEFNLTFIQGLAGEEFYITMQCGVEAEANKLGVNVNTQGAAKWDSTLQKPLVDSVVASKPDAILIAPNDVTAMRAPLQAAADAGIKVILVDTTVEDPSFATAEISSDNTGGGLAGFDAIKELNPDGGKVLIIGTDPGVSTTDARIAGFEEAVKADDSFEYLGVQWSRNDPAEAAKLVNAALAKDPDIVGIFAININAAEGSATGVRQAGKEGSVNVVSFDAGAAQVQALRDGIIQALVAQQPALIGSEGVAAAVSALKGESVEKKTQTGFQVLTLDNIDTTGQDYIYKSSC